MITNDNVEGIIALVGGVALFWLIDKAIDHFFKDPNKRE